jgi:hypothetical protein
VSHFQLNFIKLLNRQFVSFPLEHFLKWLQSGSGFDPTTFMIDCSDTEALGIKKAFFDVEVSILYCYWHLWQAWDKNIITKVSFFHSVHYRYITYSNLD